MISITRALLALLIMYVFVMPLVSIAIIGGFIAYKVGGK